MIESRCGLVCSQCEYHGEICRSCTNIAKPFWSEMCPVRVVVKRDLSLIVENAAIFLEIA